VSAWEVAAATPDPELPMVTVADLGILRDVAEEDGCVRATITPTYSGCPALREIAAGLRGRLVTAGYPVVEIRTQLSPPWSSDWITAEGRRKLSEAGIAPPHAAGSQPQRVPLRLLAVRPAVACPCCGSTRTTCTAEFGGTACKALYRCDDCLEPFEYIKEH
jgi:ring-1,2-phenylacetyl-CoA epoxidase subunit PaaD